ncbi:MAG: agmatine deiminase family protein [Muribaculaceae bacterium]|nr:agmatine deiminase family protein [Muribaculaceae bacterium]MDE6194848.1 agmatine deiminase family protein [Muribaculaceae bacterium]
MSDIRFIPEWEPVEYVLLALPNKDTDWDYILPEAIDQYRRLVKAITDEDIKVILLCSDVDEAVGIMKDCRQDLIRYILTDYNDTWTRDYGMISVVRGERLRALDFGFNAWGLKFAADKDNLVNLRLNEKGIIAPLAYRNERDFVLEGGSVESDGQGTVMTTSRCLQSPNRNGGKTKAELNRELLERLGADHVLWLDHGALEGDDTDSHIDTLARLAPDDTIVFTGTRNFDDPQFESLLAMRAQLTLFRTAEGNPYNLVELPLPDPVLDPDGQRLPATYANYLVANGVIFMPTYAQPDKDELAMRSIQIAFPGHKVVGVDCRTLLRQHGSLHCATMQIPAGIINL